MYFYQGEPHVGRRCWSYYHRGRGSQYRVGHSRYGYIPQGFLLRVLPRTLPGCAFCTDVAPEAPVLRGELPLAIGFAGGIGTAGVPAATRVWGEDLDGSDAVALLLSPHPYDLGERTTLITGRTTHR